MKVLIADDSQIVRERLAYLLGDVEGVEIVGQAEDAVEGSNLAEALKPDVAILDVRMPRGSGLDVLRSIKSHHPSATVIILTNFVDPEARQLCLARGADYFFDKSIEFDKAVDVLRGLAQPETP
ncbi:MAG TPA: response regulator transcription factor [Burkholderiales bacterium]